MTRHQALWMFLLCACLLVPTAPTRSVVAQAPAVTKKVNCNKGESINKALAKNAGAPGGLVLEITGLCHENVVVTADRVTLRGADPATDGIQAAGNTEQTDAALWVRGAQLVTVENLKLTGGFSGLLATDVGVPFLRMVNCRLEGNVTWGAQLEVALLTAEGTTFGPNERFSVGAFAGSRFECRGCTLTLSPTSTTRDNLVVFSASQALLFETALVGGGINVGNSAAALTDSSVQAFPLAGAAAVFGNGSSTVNLVRSQVEGPVRFFQGTTATLFGVTQTPGSTPGPAPNTVDDSAFVRIGDASHPAGGPPTIPSSVLGFILRNFSNATLQQNSQILGGLNCSLGANVACTTPANVSGPSNCGLCPTPSP